MSARILIADDDPAVVESVSWVLEEHGYAVTAVPGAAALLELVGSGEERPPDLLLLDIFMPDGDGVQLLERIKRDPRWRDVPVLMLSSAPVEEATVRTLGLGAADYVRKPFRVKELVARIQAQLRVGAVLRQQRDTLRRTQEELERARADAENRRKLVDILHEVTGDLAADEVYNILARRVARALSVSHCAVILAAPGRDDAVVATAFENAKLQKRPISVGDYPEVREALEHDRPVLIEELSASPLYGLRPAMGLDGTEVPVRSAMALPFTVDSAQRGVFLLRRTREQPPLTPEDVEFAEAVIGAAVAVMQRAQVIETTRADNARLEQLATRDPLTQLLNRRALTERLTTEMERALRYDHSVALLLIDLDHFKRVNDTHGHLVGDAVLRDVSELLLGVARSVDVVGRYGGEEFLVVLPETDDDGAAAFAERIRERVEAHAFRPWDEDRELRMTASIGVASFPAARIESVEDLFARADAALYRAKADGRNRVRL
ncbi:diguanylate cyclase [Roseisolibacter sp. H3M3-2]|uniref:GGDEF domain-containing response regulator n=1 Tax=Roseisolibacter sp. H3M3-2 TaxID=3031323 RepID=UPI0023DC3D0B|nr:diguanylate cyclase [Roseisolibacter sp. H3M3-2]MDF1501677.1 diguanylate cyclase [Roseisolibacter sp. H3M3-2]